MNRYRLAEGIGVYFITFTVVDWLPIFIDEQSVQVLIDSCSYCISTKFLCVCAYVVMPNHFHAVVFDKEYDNDRLHQTLTSLRKFTGNRLADYVDRHWVRSIGNILHQSGLSDRSRQFWASGWHAEGIFTESVFRQKVDYIHMNPCRKGFVIEPQHWRWSSAGYWINGKPADIPISEVLWG